jgi:hypothetical protein
LQSFEPQIADCEKARLPGREGYEILEVQAEIELKAGFAALVLERLEGFERVTPLSGDLCER